MKFRSAALFLLGSWSAIARPSDDAPTFCKDVAPILFTRCAPCHHDGGVAPFALLTHEEAARHARQIACATAKRLMPPWLPAPGFGDFADVRRLREEEIATLARWAAAGAPEGDVRELPPRPEFHDGWQLGPPDLVVTMETPFVVAAAGRDQLRNFVLPVPTSTPRWVDAIELRFDDGRPVHHATLQVDDTSGCRQLDARDPEPGFPGMSMGPSRQAGGHFVSWTPGKQPERFEEGTACRLAPGSDLVLQLHVVPTGRQESVRASIGLHFTATPPTRPVYSLVLRADAIDIPPGTDDYVVEQSFTLPVEALATRIYPHAHYLGRTMAIAATAPGGDAVPLLRIDDWNFAWQDSYRYARPVRLERGSTIAMRYVYDNSDGNARNPNHPPVRVQLGNESSDEMGAFTLELLFADEGDRREVVESFERGNVARQPDDPAHHYNLAIALAEAGRDGEAADEYRAVLARDATHLPACINLGNLLRRKGARDEAIDLYRQALAIEPRCALALHNLGAARLEGGDPAGAVEPLAQAIALQPQLVETHVLMAFAQEKLGKEDAAAAEYDAALRFDPTCRAAVEGLVRGSAARGDLEAGERWCRRAVELAPEEFPPLARLARLLANHPDPKRRRPKEAVELAERAARAAGADPIDAAECLSTVYAAAGRLAESATQLDAALTLLAARSTPSAERMRSLLLDRRRKLAEAIERSAGGGR